MPAMRPPTSPSKGPEWRLLSGWTEEELGRAFAAARRARRNFDPRPGELFRGRYHHVCSQACVAREPPGAPGRIYERLWEAVCRFEHSDPRIVVAHFHPDEPVRGRTLLLEVHVLGLRYLCPARIVASRAHSDGARTLRAIAIDTLDGHLERGREWFLLCKDHSTGEIRFRLQAAWRPGDFPNAWSHAGFLALAPRYQRAWHRLAHLRLRRLAAGLAPHVGDGGPIFSARIEMPAEPVVFYAGRKPPRDVHLEGEEEEMRGIVEPLLLGMASGLRSLAGPAAAMHGRKVAGRVFAALAAAEMVADKLPGIPPRTRLLPLAARAVSGALAASAGIEGGRMVRGILGAASAVASAGMATALRLRAHRLSPLFGFALGAAEDLVVGRVLRQRSA